MDWNAVVQDLIAAGGLGFGIWKSLQAKRTADSAKHEVAAAKSDAAEAVAHTRGLGSVAEDNQQRIASAEEAASAFAQAIADIRSRLDTAIAGLVMSRVMGKQIARRVDSLEQAVLWLSDRLEVSVEEASAAAAAYQGTAASRVSADTGRHRLPTQAVTTIQEDE